MEPVVLLFVLLAMVIVFAHRTLRRRSSSNADPSGAARASAEARGRAHPHLPPQAPGGPGA